MAQDTGLKCDVFSNKVFMDDLSANIEQNLCADRPERFIIAKNFKHLTSIGDTFVTPNNFSGKNITEDIRQHCVDIRPFFSGNYGPTHNVASMGVQEAYDEDKFDDQKLEGVKNFKNKFTWEEIFKGRNFIQDWLDIIDQNSAFEPRPFFHLLIFQFEKFKISESMGIFEEQPAEWSKFFALEVQSKSRFSVALTGQDIHQRFLIFSLMMYQKDRNEPDLILVSPTKSSTECILLSFLQDILQSIRMQVLLDIQHDPEVVNRDGYVTQARINTRVEQFQAKTLSGDDLIDRFKSFLKGFVSMDYPLVFQYDVEIAATMPNQNKLSAKTVNTKDPCKRFRYRTTEAKFDPYRADTLESFFRDEHLVYSEVFTEIPTTHFEIYKDLIIHFKHIDTWIFKAIEAFKPKLLNFVTDLLDISMWFKKLDGDRVNRRLEVTIPDDLQFTDSQDWTVMKPRNFQQLIQISEQMLRQLQTKVRFVDLNWNQICPPLLFNSSIAGLVLNDVDAVHNGTRNLGNLVQAGQGRGGDLNLLRLYAQRFHKTFADTLESAAGRNQNLRIPGAPTNYTSSWLEEAGRKFAEKLLAKKEEWDQILTPPVGWFDTFSGILEETIEEQVALLAIQHNLNPDQINSFKLGKLFKTININETDSINSMDDDGVLYPRVFSTTSSPTFHSPNAYSTNYFVNRSPKRDANLQDVFREFRDFPIESMSAERIWEMAMLLARIMDRDNCLKLQNFRQMFVADTDLSILGTTVENEMRQAAPMFLLSATSPQTTVYNRVDFTEKSPPKNAVLFDLAYTRKLAENENVMPGFGRVAPVFATPNTLQNTSPSEMSHFGAINKKFIIFEFSITDHQLSGLPADMLCNMLPIYLHNWDQNDFVLPDGEKLLDLTPFTKYSNNREKAWQMYVTSSLIGKKLCAPKIRGDWMGTRLATIMEILQNRKISTFVIFRDQTDFGMFKEATRWFTARNNVFQRLDVNFIINPEVSSMQIQTWQEAFDHKANMTLADTNAPHYLDTDGAKTRALMALEQTCPRFSSVFTSVNGRCQVSLIPNHLPLAGMVKGPWNRAVRSKGAFPQHVEILRYICGLTLTKSHYFKLLPEIEEHHVRAAQIMTREEIWEMIRDHYPTHHESLQASVVALNAGRRVRPHIERRFLQNLILHMKKPAINGFDESNQSPPVLQVFDAISGSDFAKSNSNRPVPVVNNSHNKIFQPRVMTDAWFDFSLTNNWSTSMNEKRERFMFPQVLPSGLAGVISTIFAATDEAKKEGYYNVSPIPSLPLLMGNPTSTSTAHIKVH